MCHPRALWVSAFLGRWFICILTKCPYHFSRYNSIIDINEDIFITRHISPLRFLSASLNFVMSLKKRTSATNVNLFCCCKHSIFWAVEHACNARASITVSRVSLRGVARTLVLMYHRETGNSFVFPTISKSKGLNIQNCVLPVLLGGCQTQL